MIDTATLHELLKLYRPNVPGGNCLSDVAQHGGNEVLRQALVKLGVKNQDVLWDFRRLDGEAARASAKRLAAINERLGGG